MMAVIPYRANAKPRCCGGNVSAKIACAIGCSPPPPAPCSTRKKRRNPRLGAIPQSKELTVKILKHAMKKRFRPKAPASQPLMGRMIAFETRYEVNTQVLWSLLAPRFPAIYGKATLAMLVSSTSMNAAIATTTPMSQGLYFGRQGSGGGAGGVAGVPGLVDINFGIDRHSRPQAMVVVLAGVNINA